MIHVSGREEKKGRQGSQVQQPRGTKERVLTNMADIYREGQLGKNSPASGLEKYREGVGDVSQEGTVISRD